MKKIFVIILLISAVTQLKAQQIVVKPELKLNSALLQPFKIDSLNKPLLLQPGNSFLLEKPISVNPKNPVIVVYSTMPVARVSSADRMPVANLGGSGYNMPVQKVTVINPLQTAKKQLP